MARTQNKQDIFNEDTNLLHSQRQETDAMQCFYVDSHGHYEAKRHCTPVVHGDGPRDCAQGFCTRPKHIWAAPDQQTMQHYNKRDVTSRGGSLSRLSFHNEFEQF